MKTDAQLRLFQNTADIVRGRYEAANRLLDLLEKEFLGCEEGTIGKEAHDLEYQIKTWEGVGDPDVREYIDLHRLRSYLNLRHEIDNLEQIEAVKTFDNNADTWLDDPDIRAHVKKSNGLRRLKRLNPIATVRYVRIYEQFQDTSFAQEYICACAKGDAGRKRLAKAIENATGETIKPKDLQATIDNFMAGKILQEKCSNIALEMRIAGVSVALEALKVKNNDVGAFAEFFTAYNDRRRSAVDVAQKLIYTILGNFQTASTCMQIHYSKELLAVDRRALEEFQILDALNDKIADRIGALKKSRIKIIKIAYEEAMFDADNHYQAAKQETSDATASWPSNEDFIPTGRGYDEA